MADTLDQGQPVCIVDGNNVEQGTSANPLRSADIFESGLASGAITVGTSQVEAKVGGSALAGRKGISIYHNGGGALYFGATGVTTASGTPIFKSTSIFIPASATCKVYLIAGTAGQDIRIVEFA